MTTPTTNLGLALIQGNDVVGRNLWNPNIIAIDAAIVQIASDSQSGRMSSALYTQLKNVQAGAEVNQNTYSSIKVGTTYIGATSKTDTFELVAGTWITMIANSANRSVTFDVLATSAGGTEANRLAQTNASGRVGDSEKVGGQTLTQLDARYTPASHTSATDPHPQYATDTDLSAHAGRTDNPHNATAAQVGALALTGGTMTGNVTMSKSDQRFVFDRPSGQTGQFGGMYFQDAGVNQKGIFHDYTNNKLVVVDGVGGVTSGSKYDLWHSGNHTTTGDPHSQYALKSGTTFTGATAFNQTMTLGEQTTNVSWRIQSVITGQPNLWFGQVNDYWRMWDATQSAEFLRVGWSAFLYKGNAVHHDGNHGSTGDPHPQYALETGTTDILINRDGAGFSTKPNSDASASIVGLVNRNSTGTTQWVTGHIPSSGSWAVYDSVNGRRTLEVQAGSGTSGLLYNTNIVHHDGNHGNSGDPHTQYILASGTRSFTSNTYANNTFGFGSTNSTGTKYVLAYIDATDIAQYGSQSLPMYLRNNGTLSSYRSGVAYQIFDAGNHGNTGDPHSQYMPKSGGTFTAPITLSADPTVALHAATKQYVDNNYMPQSKTSLRVYQTTTLNYTASTYTKVLFQTKSYDKKSEFDTSTSKFTALESGVYLVSGAFTWSQLDQYTKAELVIYKNGSAFVTLANMFGGYGGSGVASAMGSGQTMVKLTAGDYLEVYCYSSQSSNMTSVTGERYTYFAVEKINT